ncbi:serine hydrolase domain-containing protein [Legionella spiritensis]|uniref:serine hydrolase domain-containing protein n=1 Tax=Legionella spiritensis TaxID=452 RepID=UPI000F6E4675|nr:serine hydrolase domain-containing protein [Legionella spiritensis]VEG90872.1 (serine-type) D-alanyl-D-alanine carboxypeptidase [Legionella spiritensis]
MKKSCLALCLLTMSSIVVADKAVDEIIRKHLDKYSEAEHFSAIQVSVKAGQSIDNYAAGLRAFDEGSAPVKTTDLFDIGSITKSFTAVLAVLAEREQKLELTRTVGDYLEDYPHWGELTLTGLLNMSTGIPNYSDAPKINYLMSTRMEQYWSTEDLIGLVYSRTFNPPRKPGYFYSNTGYILMDMILNERYGDSYTHLLNTKIIKPLALRNTFYPVPDYSGQVLKRMAHGYSYNIYDNPELLGRDVTKNNLSWAGAAGAIVANSEDVVRWVDNLFVGDKLLTEAEKRTMQTLVSTRDGKPISQTDKKHPQGFGLGIIEAYREPIGRYWFYEGETLGYRALYMYVPCNKVIIAALFNSATNGENDHAGELVQTLYQHVLEQNKQLIC